MRRILLAVGILALLTPGASAHIAGEGGAALYHGVPASRTLEPGEEYILPIAFPGFDGPLPMWEGWLWVVYGSTTGGPIEFHMEHHNETLQSWTWQPGPVQMEVGRFPEAGFYEIRIHNPGTEDAQFVLAYDQSCQCSFKPVPFDGGYFVMTVALMQGDTAHFEAFTTASKQRQPYSGAYGMDVVLYRSQDLGTEGTTGDLDLLRQWQVPDSVLQESIHADRAGTYYLVARIQTDNAPDGEGVRFNAIIEGIDVEPASATIPAPHGFLLLALVGLAAAALRRR